MAWIGSTAGAAGAVAASKHKSHNGKALIVYLLTIAFAIVAFVIVLSLQTH
jgi:hypothetical protein